MSCAVDTMIAIWALKYFDLRGKGPIKDSTVVRSRMLLQMLTEEREQLIFPAIAVAEYLAPFPVAEHGRQISRLQNQFFCPGFDIHAASVAADLWLRHKSLPKSQQITERVRLKADIQIVATAKAAGAGKFYSHDKGSRTVANLVMQSFDLPASTGNFLWDGDIKNGRH